MSAKATYQVTIKTDELNASSSTKSTLSMQLVGATGEHTEWVALNSLWRKRFRRGQIDEFTIEDNDVGRPIIVRIKLDKKALNDIWGCSYIIVKYAEYTDEFPVYDWVSDSIEVVEGTATLPQKANNGYVSNTRDDEKSQNQLTYSWQKKSDMSAESWKLPRYQACQNHDDLPEMFKMYEARKERFRDLESTAKTNAFLINLKDHVFKVNCLDDYKKMFIHIRVPSELPTFIDQWESDDEFGRQILNGISPETVVRCLKIPANCNINHEHVKDFLDAGGKLEKEILHGKVYMKDLRKMTDGVLRNTQSGGTESLFCPDAMALFYSKSDGRFLPIAIQLEPNNEDSIFTPNDDKFDWVLAKIHFRCAEHNVAWGDHYMLHVVMEPVAVSLFRYLPRSHPVFKLLRPHLQSLPAVNQIDRDMLAKNDRDSSNFKALHDLELANRCYEYFDFSDLNMPERFKKQGTHDRDLLPNYPFRDDALLLWDATWKYVSKVIAYYYESDQDIVEDGEIQSWIADLAMDGYAWLDGYARGCPGSFRSKEDLVTFVTMVIYTNSVLHSAHHYPRFDYLKFIPNSPAAMRLPIHKRGEGSLEKILGSLPGAQLAALQIGDAFADTQYMLDETYLGQYPMNLFTEPEILSIMDDFRDDLKEVSAQIKERNNTLKVPYEYLLPEKIPASITA